MDIPLQSIFSLILALVLGGLIGLEREYKRKGAGLQTNSLVALGACLFTEIAFGSFNSLTDKTAISFDPSRVVQAVAIGIGFIGAGIIIYRQSRVEGLTTAAGLWVAAAIGVAAGAGLYFLAIFTCFLAILVLFGLGAVERRLFRE